MLSLLIESSGASAREIDRLTGRAENQTALIIARKQRKLRADIATAYARVFGCTAGYLLTGEGNAPTPDQIRNAVARARAEHAAHAISHTASDFAVSDDPRPSQAA